MGDMTAKPHRYPWEPPTTDETVALLQRDILYMVTHTAILVQTPHAALSMLVNTKRGQIMPRGECRFTDGTTLEFQDIGMPQPKAPEMTVKELVARVWQLAAEQGLELAP